MVEAADEFREALRLRPGWTVPSNNLAWILATDEDPALRNPEEAVSLAEDAVRGTERKNPEILDTLALAYAAAGRRDEAVATARNAVAVARAQQRDDLIPSLEERVHAYENPGSAARH
jgi:Flp pilus assembly protein TadD